MESGRESAPRSESDPGDAGWRLVRVLPILTDIPGGSVNHKKVNKIVLAYSGGLDTSVILRWLVDTYQCPVIAFAADLGQGEELAPLEEKAKATGAASVQISD